MTVKGEFDLFLDRVRPFLVDYLEEKGIDTSKNFRCLDPKHKDKLASATCGQFEERGYSAYCFSCRKTFDIFDAYSILENKPTNGRQWLSDVVYPLASKYGVVLPKREITLQEQFQQYIYKVYGNVVSLLNHDISKMNKGPREYIEEREWLETTLEHLDIGTIDYKAIQKEISRDDLEKSGLLRPDLFNPNNLIFTTRDKYNRPIRFFARTFDDKKKKWRSTNSTDLFVDIWTDKGHLYLSHLLDKREKIACVVEGQGDATSLYQNDFQNVVASHGISGFSASHVNLLMLSGISEIIFIFDGDERGRNGIESLLKKDFIKCSGLRCGVVQLPAEHDPDSFVRTFGPDTLRHLIDIRLSAFEYLLSKQDPSGNAEKISEELIPYIASDPSEISREVMCRSLATFFRNEVSIGAILADVKRSDQAVLTAVFEKEKMIVGAASKEAQRNVGQAKEIFREATNRIDEVRKDAGLVRSLEAETMARVQNCKTWQERDRGNAIQSFQLIPHRMGRLGEILSSSDWATGGNFIVVGAVENMGKTSFVTDLAWQIVSNKDNKARVFIQTLDDPHDGCIRRLVCQAYGSPKLTMNMVANPRYFYEQEGINNVYEMREEGYSKVMEAVADGRIIIKDSTDGKTVSYADAQLQQMRRKHPDDNIVWILDNFHNVMDWETLDMRQRFTNVSKYIKNLSQTYHLTPICTAEYRKNDPSKIGTNEDLAEARAIKYDAQMIMHIFSDAHVKGVDNAELVHPHNDDLYPRLQVRAGKNKITDFKGDFVLDFFPASALFFRVDEKQAEEDLQQRVSVLREKAGRVDQ